MAKCKNFSSNITNSISDKFYKTGFFISSHPWKVIICTFIIVGICCSGFLKFQIERDPLELWIPRDSKFLSTTKWLLNNLDIGFRTQSVLITAPNVLEPKVLMKLLRIHDEISKVNGKLRNGTEVNWDNTCFRIPFIPNAIQAESLYRQKRNAADIDQADDQFSELFEETESLTGSPKRPFNPSIDLKPAIYCKFINALPWGCYEKNVLELWNYTDTKLENLHLNDILLKFKNATTISPVTGHDTDFRELLGGIQYDDDDNIIGAKSILVQWYVNLNMTDVGSQRRGNLAGTEDWITEEAAVWEDGFLQKMEELQLELNDDNEFKIYYAAAKSFGDISYKTMFQETDKLAIGIILMFMYIQVVLSKFSWIEFRFSLGGLGLLSVGLAFISACGICSFLGIPYGPVHTSLPFLLMGLGVDDMFVLMACWRKVQSEKEFTIEERIGKMLKHAGSSITVTSLTDIIAFLVGSFTVIPSLQSFCLYAAVGVFMTYFYAITFYIAVFTLDEYRIAGNRNTIIPCIIHKNEQKLCCNLELMHKSLNWIYGKFILTKGGKTIILMAVIALTGISTKNLFQLNQKFDPIWFIPETTYLSKYVYATREYYPYSGYTGSIFMGKLNYTDILPKLEKLTREIEENDEMYFNVNSWVKPFFKFMKTYYYRNLNQTREKLTEEEWRFYISKFLFSPNGGKYQANFRFVKPLKCSELAPKVRISWIDFRFKKFSSRDDYIPAMKNLTEFVRDKHFEKSGDGFAEVWSRAYANWITDEIIDKEVYRNIILALVCVMFCTYAIIINLQVCFWIFICVLLTLVNVGGFMHVWGLTIDLVSCIGLQLAVGLCVDYAAHVGHTFLVCNNGDRNKRVLDTILHIGAAVLYGGGSTLLSLLLLSKSEAYTFQSFFKIFLLVILFGLFHGVILLPVILSLVGPSPYNKEISAQEELKPMNGNKLEPKKKDIGNLKEGETDKLNEGD